MRALHQQSEGWAAGITLMLERLGYTDTEAGTLLDDLYRRHLFTDRRPGIEPVYQFHALFRDFLQRRAGEAIGLRGVRQLVVRSAELLEANGDIGPAMDLRIAAQDWHEAMRLALRAANTLPGLFMNRSLRSRQAPTTRSRTDQEVPLPLAGETP